MKSAMAMVRAAYGQGYVDSLSESPPIPLEQARARAQYFWSQLPV